ncbi:MAG: hypothetical protein LCH39_01530 [Proteobacteria bacterium]|nr:hypothetical protein [Pseudomonadota bacterium]
MMLANLTHLNAFRASAFRRCAAFMCVFAMLMAFVGHGAGANHTVKAVAFDVVCVVEASGEADSSKIPADHKVCSCAACSPALEVSAPQIVAPSAYARSFERWDADDHRALIPVLELPPPRFPA